MAEALTIDGTPVPVLRETWKETIFVPGSRARTETGVLRSVRLGCPVSQFTGQSFFALRVDADVLRDILLTYGDHVVSGWLPGRAVICETECGPIEAIDHRPRGVDPTAQWRLSWTLTQTHCAEEVIEPEPAGVMLVTNIIGSNSADRIQVALEAVGHTVTQIDHDEFSTGFTPFSPYEVIVTSQILRNSSKGAKIREVIQSGRGVVNMCDFTPDGIQVPLLNSVGLHAGTSYLYVNGNSKEVVVTGDPHEITDGFMEQVLVLTYDARRVQVLNGAVIGTVLATGCPFNANLADKAAIVAYEIGTPYLTAPFVSTLARVAFLGWAPDTTTLTVDGTTFIQRAVEWVLAGGGS